MSAAAAFHEPTRVGCPWCDSGSVDVSRDEHGEPLIVHVPAPACVSFTQASEATFWAKLAPALRATPCR